MRLEAIEKEAELYHGEGECYIHIERAGNSPITCVVSGDSAAISQAVYNLVCHLSLQLNKSVPDVLKMFKRAYKQFGIPEHKLMGEDSEQAGGE